MNPAASANSKAVEPEVLQELQTLNGHYIRSVQASDVEWFDRNLAADFVCCNSNGVLVDRAQFLRQTAIPAAFSNLEVHDVMVRILGDFALIHARTTFTRADGNPGSSRYTDAWARQQGRWLAVSAHITPVP